jgi:hypothetical protein
MSFALNVPLNSVSFGQLSTAISKEIMLRGEQPAFFPIGQVDLSAQGEDAEFIGWLNKCTMLGLNEHSRGNPSIKLWHLNNDSILSPSTRQSLVTFYELDSPTPHELNVIKNNDKVYVTSEYTKEVFTSAGADNVEYLPLFFDSRNFQRKDETYHTDDRITFNLAGKFERRKHHGKILNTWAKKFGNNKKFYLNCALYNSFIKPEQNEALVRSSLEGENYFNINCLSFMGKNSVYNDFLNSGDIIIGMSGGEGWGLPEFQSVAMGKHSVILNANGYKSWANEKNSILVEPKAEKIPAYDGVFFNKGNAVNQGNIFDWNEDDFISACEESIKRVESDRLNKEGLELQSEFSVDKTVNILLEGLSEK